MKITIGMLVLLTCATITPASNAYCQSSDNVVTPAGHYTEQPARDAVEKIVREYIMQHPEVLVESVQLYQDRLRTAQKEHAKAALTSKLSDLQEDPSSPVTGAANGVTVVEFFDYRCGFCRKAESTMTKLIADHPDVRFVFKEFPILGPESLTAAKAALAAQKQGDYLKFHRALMTLAGPITTGAVETLAREQGLDVARLKTDMESPAVAAILERNHQLAEQVGVTATPTFVVNSELVPGAVEAPALENMIRQAKLRKTSQPTIIEPQ